MSARRGFTLIEVLVGIAIGGALLGALGVFTLNLTDTRARLAEMTARVDSAEVVFSALDRALATAVVEDASLGAGVSGNESALRVVRSAVGLGGEREALFAETGVVEVRLSRGAARLEIVRDGRAAALPAPVRAMRIRYLGERGWSDAFDSGESGVFPAGIEVSIWFGGDEEAELAGGGASTRSDASTGSDARTDARDGVAGAPSSASSLSTLDAPPDRRRFFRIAGSPRVDALALRSIRDGEGSP
ncbi:MAG: prepilin-type N-terminal cleavage/methylation domain-containing protein [Phycisphaera sp.]|nr:prepilin-type N-terminal cleavage/methylation domain-containing protein [Phycisphaera sp.]